MNLPAPPPTSIRRLAGVAAIALGLVPSTSIAQELPPDPTRIDPAMAVHVSADGLQALGAAVGRVVPTGLRAINLSGEIDCDEDEEGVLEYAADDLQVHLSADTVEMVPSEGRLDVHLGMTVWSDPAQVTAVGTCVLELSDTCTLELAPTNLDVDVGILLALVDGVIDASIDGFTFTHGNFGNPVAPGCVLGDALETMQGLGVDIIGTILDDVLGSQIEELETQLEDILNGLTQGLAFNDTLEALGATITYAIEADTLEVSPTGIHLGFTAAFGALEYGACVPREGAYAPASHDMPPLTGVIPDTNTPYHVAIVVNEDMINQALYAVWQAGMLCLDVAALEGIDINTAFLEPAAPDIIPELWPDPIDLDLRTTAAAPPTAEFEGGPTIDAALLLNVFGPELDRTTRYWANGLFINAGLGIALEAGSLNIDIGFDLETQLGVTVAYNEWLPSAIPEGFAGLVPTLVPESLIPSDLSFPIPSLFGLTLHSLDMRVVGAEGDFLGLYGWIDPNQVEPMVLADIDLAGIGCGDTAGGGGVSVPGCEGEDGGCATEETGCSSEEGGCSSCSEEGGGCEEGACTNAPRRVGANSVIFCFLPLLVAARRRR
jgi:hypothetical protein